MSSLQDRTELTNQKLDILISFGAISEIPRKFLKIANIEQ